MFDDLRGSVNAHHLLLGAILLVMDDSQKKAVLSTFNQIMKSTESKLSEQTEAASAQFERSIEAYRVLLRPRDPS